MTARVKKTLLSLLVVLGFSSYALKGKLGDAVTLLSSMGEDDLQEQANVGTGTTTINTNLGTSTTTNTNTTSRATNTNTSTGRATNTNTPTSSGKYKDGAHTGPVVDVFYGNVQVQAVVSGGKLTDVKILQYPNDRQTSRYIAQQSLPILTSEAINAQTANVNGVSGATQTSRGFITSLSSALKQAQ